MRMLVLGAGLQGSACAYDLLQDKQVEQVRLADLKINHLPHFLAPYSGRRLLPTPVDVRDEDAVRGLMRECDAVMSAIPYYFNFDMARLAVDAGVHFTDLGGNTEMAWGRSRRFIPRAGSRPWPSGMRARSRKWSTRRSAIPATPSAWKRFGSSDCWISTRSTSTACPLFHGKHSWRLPDRASRSPKGRISLPYEWS